MMRHRRSSRRSFPRAAPLEPLERRLMLSDVVPLTPERVAVGPEPFADSGPAAVVASAAGPGPGLPVRPSLQWTTGLKRILYVRAAFADDPNHTPQTLASARRSMAFADSFVRANSYGLTSFKSSFTDVVVLPRTEADYQSLGWERLRSDALAAGKAQRPSWDSARYDLDVIRYDGGPAPDDAHSVGFSNTGGRGTWLRSSEPVVATHELGHNLGLYHANLWEGADPDAPAGPGRTVEYGNSYDLMGSGGDAGLSAHFNAYEKNFLGWLPDGAVETIDRSGTYTVHPADSTTAPGSGQSYALKVRKDDLRDYWLSSRADAYWSGNASLSGLEVDWGAWSKDGIENSNLGSHLLDMTPQTPADRFDYGLPLGSTFTDDVIGLHVTPLRRDASSAVEVRVEFDDDQDTPDAAAPEPPTIDVSGASAADEAEAGLFPRAVYTATAGKPFSLAATSSDADGDDLAYAWDFGNGAAGGSVGPGGVVKPASAGAAAAMPAVTARYDVPGVYRAQVTVSDLRGKTATSTVIIEVTSNSSPDAAAGAGNVVTGRVIDALGNPMGHVRVAGGRSWAYTDSDGTYVLAGLPPQAVTLAATTPGGWSFELLNSSNPLNPGPVTRGVDFRGTPVGYHITGAVTTSNSFGVGGVLVSDGALSTLTDGLGRYSLPAQNGPHTLTFTRRGYPVPDVPVVVNNGDTTADVKADVQFVNGFIRNIPAAVRTLLVGNGQGFTEATLNGGGGGQAYYTFQDFPHGSWTFTAVGRGADGKLYNFAPSGFTNPFTVDGIEQNVNFTYAPDQYLVTGRVSAGPDAIAGAAVTATDARTGDVVASATTDGSGAYAMLVRAENIVLRARRQGLLIIPFQAPLTVSANQTGVNFKLFAPSSDKPPAVVAPAAAEPDVVTGTSTWLSTYSTDDRDTDRLTYTWRVVSGPAGADVSFSRNGDNTARRTLATFDRPGEYQIEAAAADTVGGRSTSVVTVTVVPVPSALRLDQGYRVLPAGGVHRFSAVVVDQFGLVVDAAPRVTWRAVGATGLVAQDGTFTADARPPAAPVRGSVVASVALPGGGELVASTTVDLKPAAAVAGRHLFYNNSAYDSFNGHALPGDDSAIAPDKRALLPGDGRATAANYSGYAKGINGVMVDLDGAWSDAVGADDFEFAVGYGAASGGWTAAPTPEEVAARRLFIDGRSVLRVSVVWDDGAIRNQWLRVTVEPTDRTGLAAPDVFYFGNLAGDTGDAPAGATKASVTALDVERTLRRNVTVGDLDSAFDHNHDGVVTVADADVTRRNRSAWIRLITGDGAA